MRGRAPDPDLFPEFDDNLREAFSRETEMFFDSQLREDRSVLDLLTPNYTFVNERLARHYGIPGVYGSHFRRVTLTDDRRARPARPGQHPDGDLVANRTSPVVRGKWMLENLLGAPPPPPPPNVPALKRTTRAPRRPRCASGWRSTAPTRSAPAATRGWIRSGSRWRTSTPSGAGGATTSRARPIDASGVLPDGTELQRAGRVPSSAAGAPATSSSGAVTEKLLTYALGRGLEYYDMPAVRADYARRGAGRLSLVVDYPGIVESVPFRMRVIPEGAVGTVSARSGGAQQP